MREASMEPQRHPARGASCTHDSVDRRRSSRPQRVLVVDDSADIRELWRLWLTFWGFSVHEARNGYDAIPNAAEVQPDLILMDLWMPVVDGVEAMRRLKADSRTS